MMKAIEIKEPWSVSCKEVEKPIPKKNEARIRIMSAGICGSDIGAYKGENGLVIYPRIIGHELAGIIEEIPYNSNSNLKIGDRVIVNPYLYCGECYPCSLGRTNCCVDLKCLGVHVEGGISEYFCHPLDMLIKIPDNIDWETACMIEPLVIALHGLHRGNLREGEYVAIIGAGPIGLLAAMAAKAMAATPILLDILDTRLEYAKKCGISNVVNVTKQDSVKYISELTNGRMAELVCECSGANSAIRSALQIVSSAGRITLTGWPKKETLLPTDVFTRKELDVRGARTARTCEFADAIEMIQKGFVDVRKVLTKTISIDEAPETIRDIAENPENYLKVSVSF